MSQNQRDQKARHNRHDNHGLMFSDELINGIEERQDFDRMLTRQTFGSIFVLKKSVVMESNTRYQDFEEEKNCILGMGTIP